MEDLVQPSRLRHRVLTWVQEEISQGNIPPKANTILEAILYRGELPRADAVEILNVGDRQTRRITSGLIETGVITSENPRASLKLAFPAKLASRWLPGLFPDK